MQRYRLRRSRSRDASSRRREIQSPERRLREESRANFRGSELHAVTTGERGRFTLDGLEAGHLDLTARADGFAFSATQALELAEGETRRDVVLTLRAGARLTGVVYAPDGGFAASRKVTLMATSEGVRRGRADRR